MRSNAWHVLVIVVFLSMSPAIAAEPEHASRTHYAIDQVLLLDREAFQAMADSTVSLLATLQCWSTVS
jgi:hypothetical protein